MKKSEKKSVGSWVQFSKGGCPKFRKFLKNLEKFGGFFEKMAKKRVWGVGSSLAKSVYLDAAPQIRKPRLRCRMWGVVDFSGFDILGLDGEKRWVQL